MKNVVLVLIIFSLASCKLFKKPSGGGGGGGSFIKDPSRWLSDNVPMRNSCLGMETDPTEDDIHITPASSKYKWKKEWSEALYEDFGKMPYKSLIAEGVLKQETWDKIGCPNYKNLYDKQRRAVWVTFMAELARLESGHNEKESCHDGGKSCGLYQINASYASQPNTYGCKPFSAFDAIPSGRCTALILNKTFRNHCKGKIPCAGGSGRPTIGYFGPFEGPLHSGSKYKAFFRSMRSHISANYPFCSRNKEIRKKRGEDITWLAEMAIPKQDLAKRLGQKSVKDNRCDHITDEGRGTISIDEPSNDIFETTTTNTKNQDSSQR